MGIKQLQNLKNYWSTSITTDLPFFRSVFARNRFIQILGTLHIGNINGDLKCDKIEPLLDHLVPAFQSSYTLSQHVAIDESVIAFKGRVTFRQYLKIKPTPWGIKAFVLADSVSGYLYKVAICYGWATELVRPELPHTARVVLTLVDG